MRATRQQLPDFRVSKTILLFNGPNLNLLGVRQPEVYGRETLADVETACQAIAEAADFKLEMRQSNHEGVLIDWIQEARTLAAGLIINPGAFTHTSIAIHDALLSFDGPVIEVHVSNIHRREEFRHWSYVSQCAEAVIAGCGAQGYELAVQRMVSLLRR